MSRGKHLLTRIGDDLTLHTHFRMDGTWHLYRPGERWRGGPDWQVRAILTMASGRPSAMPWRQVGDVPDLGAVVGQARRLLTVNRDHPSQVTTGMNRRGHEHWVYERAKKPCRRCGTAVEVAAQGAPPFDRLTYWCPTCQPSWSL